MPVYMYRSPTPFPSSIGKSSVWRFMAVAPSLQVCFAQLLENFDTNNMLSGRINRRPVKFIFSGSWLIRKKSFSILTDQSNLQRGVDVVCATPGRLRDLIRRRSISLDKLEFLVLDEADEMLKVSHEKKFFLLK